MAETKEFDIRINELNPRWVAYCKVTPTPTLRGFINWISDKTHAYKESTGKARYQPITDQDDFTAYIEKEVK